MKKNKLSVIMPPPPQTNIVIKSTGKKIFEYGEPVKSKTGLFVMQKMRQIGLSFCVRKSRKFYHRFIGTMFLFQMLMARKAFAAGLAWEDTLDVFVESITGPVARGVSILACCTLGGLLLFSEVGGMAKRIVQAIFGIACILYAAQIIATIGG